VEIWIRVVAATRQGEGEGSSTGIAPVSSTRQCGKEGQVFLLFFFNFELRI